MIQICAIASGSNGNCYYIGNDTEAVLIDAGISRRQLLKRMREKKLDIRKVKAIFISHEHADHVNGFRLLCELQGVVGCISKQTFKSCRKFYLPDKVKLFEPGTSLQVGNIIIHPFLKEHDTIEPCSFRLEIGDYNIGVMTDIGSQSDELRKNFAVCNAVFLESNYDIQMLMDGKYPQHLKDRVSSGKGHFSNDQALQFVKESAGEMLSTIFLSHISAENNTVDIALKTFDSLKSKYKILATNRFDASEVVELG
jgi:phosphoribosyl 1,2-cyclic phosphodiesterase